MDLGLAGKVAIVGGGSRGCGYAITAALAAEGARVVFSSRSREALDHATERLRGGGEVHGVIADLNVKADAQRLVQETRDRFGDPLVLVVNPANSNHQGGFEETTDEAFITSNDDWIMSHVHLLREVLPAMKAARWGRVVSIGSLAQKTPNILHPLYTGNIRVSSAALIKTFSGEFGHYGITANTICTGPMRSENVIAYMQGTSYFVVKSEEAVQRSAAKRWGEPHELGGVVAFLCSEQASYIQGEAIRVDGGFTHSLF